VQASRGLVAADKLRICACMLQELLRPGLEVIVHDSSSQQDTTQPSRQALELGQVLTIAEAATPSRVLAAASKAALVSLSHEQLVAAFDRVSAGMDSWQQLAPVIEEPPEELWDRQGDGQSSGGLQGKEEAAAGPADDEPIEDRTFLTGRCLAEVLPCVIYLCIVPVQHCQPGPGCCCQTGRSAAHSLPGI
jgi:hypothetical protein